MRPPTLKIMLKCCQESLLSRPPIMCFFMYVHFPSLILGPWEWAHRNYGVIREMGFFIHFILFGMASFSGQSIIT